MLLSTLTLLGLGLFVYQELREFKKRYRQATEEPLADSVELLAATLSHRDRPLSELSTETFAQAFKQLNQKPLTSQIYDLSKHNSDLRVYVTSKEGIVLYDSAIPSAQGMDYSRWNDVIRALRGTYGARSTRDGLYSVLYVAAPIYSKGEIIGAITLGKSVRTLDIFIRNAKETTITFACIYGAATVAALILLSLWITQPLTKLTRYAREIAQGKVATLPSVSRDEIGTMAKAFEEMRIALEGKKYIERYLQALSHEIKSPLSGIQGALEILEDVSITPAERSQFLGHIQHESRRLSNLSNKLLSLSLLEAGSRKPKFAPILLDQLMQETIANFSAQSALKECSIQYQGDPSLSLMGDYQLLSEALSNIIDNALSFSPRNSTLEIRAQEQGSSVRIEFLDQGRGIPLWAIDKVTEKFFSLPRPDGERKSTGLGLALVQEIALLHRGSFTLANRGCGGACAVLTLEKSAETRYT